MAEIDVLCIGNAIVDIIARCEDDFLVENGIARGAMSLIDRQRAEELYARMGPAVETSGGSAANTAAGIAGLGGSVAFSGKVADDHLGQVFAHDIRAQGVAYEHRPLVNGATTARCMIFVTPDGERSMNTYLGACVEFGREDLVRATVEKARCVYFEGYLWDPPGAKDAIREAAAIARAAGREVAMTLSDPFCVDRYREEFLELLRTGTVDTVFANEHELISLYQTASFDTALESLRADCRLGVVTRSEKGSVIVSGEQTVAIEAFPVERVVDSTGAGDLFAAGFLYGRARGLSLADCGRLGSFAASRIIQQIGPRLQYSLRQAALQAGLAI